MPECRVVRTEQPARVTLQLYGTFDGPTAWSLRRSLETEAAGEICIDFSQVREFYDLGVAILAHGFAEARRRRLLLRGLRRHQLRMFKYFGVEVEDLGARDDDAPHSVAGAFEPDAVAHL